MSTTIALTAGARLEFDFPELPETLFAMCQSDNKPVARLQACLPANYTSDKCYPLFVYLHGGAGAQGGEWEADYVRKLTGDTDFIGVTLPLFKRAIDAQEVHGGIYIGAFDDYPLIAECYRVMLTTLFAAVPNIAHGQGTLGGFSNGAHTIALLLSAVDPFILEHFNNFYLLDGGIIITSLHKAPLKQKNYLYMVGGSRLEKWRRLMLRMLEAGRQEAKASGLNMRLVKMPGVEHDFPDSYIETLRGWVRRMVRRGASDQ